MDCHDLLIVDIFSAKVIDINHAHYCIICITMAFSIFQSEGAMDTKLECYVTYGSEPHTGINYANWIVICMTINLQRLISWRFEVSNLLLITAYIRQTNYSLAHVRMFYPNEVQHT